MHISPSKWLLLIGMFTISNGQIVNNADNDELLGPSDSQEHIYSAVEAAVISGNGDESITLDDGEEDYQFGQVQNNVNSVWNLSGDYEASGFGDGSLQSDMPVNGDNSFEVDDSVMQTKFKRNFETKVNHVLIGDLDDRLEEITMTSRGPKPGQKSLVIVFDATGSMKDDLEQLRAGAEKIIDEITKRNDNPIYNYIFVPFRDPCKWRFV